MKKIIILSDVFPLGEAYEPGFLYYGMSIAPAFHPDEPGDLSDVPELLAPWKWSIEEVKVDGVVGAASIVQVPHADQSGKEKWSKSLDSFLVSQYTSKAANIDSFVYEIESDTSRKEIQINDNSEIHRDLKWHAFLMNMATSPYPLPHLANLVCFFKMDKAIAPASVNAALQFTVNSAGLKLRFTPASFADYQFAYTCEQVSEGSEGPTFSAIGYGPGCPKDVINDSKNVDLVTGWFREFGEDTNADFSVTAEDWTSGLRKKLSPMFNLPSMLSHFDGELKDGIFAKAIVYGIIDLAGLASDQLLSADSVLRLIFQSMVDTNLLPQSNWNLFSTLLNSWWNENRLNNRWLEQLGLKTLEVNDAEKIRLLLEKIADPTVLASAYFVAIDQALSGQEFWTNECKQKLQMDVLPTLGLLSTREATLLEPVWQVISKLEISDQRINDVFELDNKDRWTDDALQSYVSTLKQSCPTQFRLIACVISSVRNYISARFGELKGSPYSVMEPRLDSAAASAIEEQLTAGTVFSVFLKEIVIRYCRENILRQSVKSDELPASDGAENIAFCVDAFDDNPTHDFRPYISGIGLLMKDKRKPDWNCVNLADIGVNGTIDAGDAGYKGQDLVHSAALVPLTLHESDGVRQSFITYSNRALSGENADSLAASAGFVGECDYQDPIYLLRNAYPGGHKHRLPRLLYGETFEAIPFLVRKGGALPKELADTYPAKTSSNRLNSVSGFAARKYSASFPRRMKFGSLCINDLLAESPNGETGALKLPIIPGNVYPQAANFTDSKDTLNHLILLVSEKDATAATYKETRAEFDFYVHFPSCDFKVWERCPGSSDINVFHDAFVKERKHRNDIANATETNEPTALQFSLHDPFVDAIYFELKDLSTGIEVKPAKLISRRAIDRDASTTDAVTYHSIPVHITTPAPSASTPPPPIPDPNSIHFEVPSGAVYQLRICAAVESVNVAKLHPSLLKDKDGNSRPRFDSHMLLEAETYLIEVATPELPSAELLRNALVASLEKSTKSSSMPKKMSFDMQLESALSSVEKAQFKYLGRVELGIQRWNWQGRPFPDDCKFDEQICSNDWSNDWKDWDGALFGQRLDDDVRLHDCRIDLVGASTGHLIEQDISGDLSAQYYRFFARVYSRYEGIFGSKNVDTRGRNDTGYEWNRFLIPCRITDSILTPPLRMLVPLTECTDDVHATVIPTAGVLAVINGPWCEIGGPGEFLEVEFDTARDPNLPLSEPDEAARSLTQYGPDPLLTGIAHSSEIPLPKVVGPVGYTFDTHTLAPNFVNTGFVIHAPELVENTAWDFAKLKFRRTVPNVLRKYDEISSKGNKGLVLEIRNSIWTPSTWCQFLPSSSYFNWKEVGALHKQVAIHRAKEMFLLEDTAHDGFYFVGPVQDPRMFVPVPGPELSETDSKIEFSFFILLTQVVFDSFGNANKEAFYGIFECDSSTGLALRVYPSKLPPRLPGSLRARIMEVQHHKDQKDDLFESILLAPSVRGSDCGARIVRVSEPCVQRDDQKLLKNLKSLPKSALELVQNLTKSSPHMYLDRWGQICVGYGHVIKKAEDVASINMVDRKTQKVVGALRREFDWNNINVNRQKARDEGTSCLTYLDLVTAVDRQLLYADLFNKQDDLRRLYPHYDEFSENVRIALLVMIHDLGGKLALKFPKFNEHINKREFKLAAEESERLNVSDKENAFVKQLLMSG